MKFTKENAVQLVLDNCNAHQQSLNLNLNMGKAFAPTNIALIKYWGQSNQELNLPITDSLSIGLRSFGAHTQIEIIDKKDIVILNNQPISEDTEFYIRIKSFLDLFRKQFNYNFKVQTWVNIPIAAGLASSACGFAALVLALNDLFQWGLHKQQLSILARLGSGSACRSLWDGFVYWQKGEDVVGSDSYAYPLEKFIWPDLCIGLLIVSKEKKYISSREAMQQTVDSSVLYTSWPQQVTNDLVLIRESIHDRNFELFGQTIENNAMAMHATMLAAKPAICYYNEHTLLAMQKVWSLRKQGLLVYFTQDAGPNLKLIFQQSNRAIIEENFPCLQTVEPFAIK